MTDPKPVPDCWQPCWSRPVDIDPAAEAMALDRGRAKDKGVLKALATDVRRSDRDEPWRLSTKRPPPPDPDRVQARTGRAWTIGLRPPSD